MKNAQIDLISNGQAYGDVANFLMDQDRIETASLKPFIAEDGKPYISVFKGGDKYDPESYTVLQVNAATLRRDEWKTLDEAVMMVKRQNLIGIQDLVDRNLTYNIGDGMASTVLEWHDVSDSQEALMDMEGVSKGEGDRPVYQHNYLPLPIIHVDYEIGTRALRVSRKMQYPIDTTVAESATRRVTEKLESLLFTNDPFSYGELDSRNRNTIYSYVNFPDRNQVTLSVGWDDSSKTGKQIVDEVLSMVQASINARHRGPWMLYIPTAYQTAIDEDYSDAKGSNTIRQRIKAIEGIIDVKTADFLPADNVVLVQMTSDVVRLVQGMDVTNVQWKSGDGMLNKFKVMTIQVPQIRSDQNKRTGIVHLA